MSIFEGSEAGYSANKDRILLPTHKQLSDPQASGDRGHIGTPKYKISISAVCFRETMICDYQLIDLCLKKRQPLCCVRKVYLANE